MKNILTAFILMFCTISICQTVDWSKGIGGPNNDEGKSIIVDNDGNVYTLGIFQDSINIHSEGEDFKLKSKGKYDFFILKLDASGELVWLKKFGGKSNDVGISLAIDVDENIIATGYYNDKLDSDPNEGVNMLVSNGRDDIFIIKLNSNGELVYSKTIGGSGDDRCFRITSDMEGNVFMTGSFENTVDFDPSSNEFIQKSKGRKDVFVEKLDRNGDFQWARCFGGKSYDFGLSITIDEDGNIYSTGYFRGDITIDLDSTIIISSSNLSDNVFVQKINTDGDLIWVKIFDGKATDTTIASTDISVSKNGSIYIIGYFSSQVDFDPGFGENIIEASGLLDMFVTKLDVEGEFQWVKQFGNSRVTYAEQLVLDKQENILIVGNFGESVDFDPNIGTTILEPYGHNDVFLLKLNKDGEFVYVNNYGSDKVDQGRSICLNEEDEIFITGFYYETFRDGYGNVLESITSNGRKDIFIAKLNQSALFIDELDESSFSIFPNPNNGVFSFFNTFEYPIDYLYIFNSNNQIVFNLKDVSNLNVIKTRNLPSGIYYILIESNQTKKYAKFIISE